LPKGSAPGEVDVGSLPRRRPLPHYRWPMAQPGSGGDDRTRLVLLYGGRSAEHEVSCISAHHVLGAADPARYQVRVVGITTGGHWIDATDVVAALGPDATALPDPDALPDPETGPDPEPGPDRRTLPADRGLPPAGGLVPALAAAGGDVVVFPVLHGPHGEDGTVQGLLEMAGVAYVGAGVAGSAAAMDKGMAKALFTAAGIPQARYLTLRADEVDELVGKRIEAELGWPVFVKPANLGSTIGISRAGDPTELAAAIDLALRYDEDLVVEEEIEAREIEVGVLGGADLRVSVAGEILPSRGFYDYEDKYLAGTARWQIPAELPPGVAEQIPDLARAACRALRVEGMARVDFFLDVPTGRLLVNEVNTIPGFTPISMYPQMWAASGLNPSHLLDELVALAVQRRDRRSRFATHRP
jgi:D-alanine-D-alanine ligase